MLFECSCVCLLHTIWLESYLQQGIHGKSLGTTSKGRRIKSIPNRQNSLAKPASINNHNVRPASIITKLALRTCFSLADVCSSLAASRKISRSGRISSTSRSNFRRYVMHSTRSDNRGMTMIWQIEESSMSSIVRKRKIYLAEVLVCLRQLADTSKCSYSIYLRFQRFSEGWTQTIDLHYLFCGWHVPRYCPEIIDGQTSVI